MKKYIIIRNKFDLKVSQWSCNMSVTCSPFPHLLSLQISDPLVNPASLSVTTVMIVQTNKEVGGQWYIHTRESHHSKSHPTWTTLNSAGDACADQAVINALFRNTDKTKTLHPKIYISP